MSPPTRKKPAPPKSRPPRNATNGSQFIAHRYQGGYAAPDAEDRADQAVLAAAAALGYRIAVQCVDCGHWLANPISVAAFRGPHCRAKAGGGA